MAIDLLGYDTETQKRHSPEGEVEILISDSAKRTLALYVLGKRKDFRPKEEGPHLRDLEQMLGSNSSNVRMFFWGQYQLDKSDAEVVSAWGSQGYFSWEVNRIPLVSQRGSMITPDVLDYANKKIPDEVESLKQGMKPAIDYRKSQFEEAKKNEQEKKAQGNEDNPQM